MIFRAIRMIIGAAILFLIGYYFGMRGIRFYQVISESMLPTLEVGDRLIGEKFKKLEYGDIVVLDDPLEKNSVIIKRVVGLEGDLIEVRNDGYLYRNRERVNEPYISEKPTYVVRQVKLKRGEIFVLGDNRNNSADSSVWGPIAIESIHAKIKLRYWPVKRIARL
ncbi:MAG: signal peptidase I [Candidatus Omnitrophica bacterium]|nr:signal peptidase I [Candidatus Omnitrophota bacterium]MCM8788998.1 signal peptidase I [Candidatus Omnitrophota bacterium]